MTKKFIKYIGYIIYRIFFLIFLILFIFFIFFTYASYQNQPENNRSMVLALKGGAGLIYYITIDSFREVKFNTFEYKRKEAEKYIDKNLIITLADEIRLNLPPAVDPEEEMNTLAGIDKNNNGIKDDAERYIKVKYENDPVMQKLLILGVQNEMDKILIEQHLDRAEDIEKKDQEISNCIRYILSTNDLDKLFTFRNTVRYYTFLSNKNRSGLKHFLEIEKKGINGETLISKNEEKCGSLPINLNNIKHIK